jgi:hypothetical protein
MTGCEFDAVAVFACASRASGELGLRESSRNFRLSPTRHGRLAIKPSQHHSKKEPFVSTVAHASALRQANSLEARPHASLTKLDFTPGHHNVRLTQAGSKALASHGVNLPPNALLSKAAVNLMNQLERGHLDKEGARTLAALQFQTRSNAARPGATSSQQPTHPPRRDFHPSVPT